MGIGVSLQSDPIPMGAAVVGSAAPTFPHVKFLPGGYMFLFWQYAIILAYVFVSLFIILFSNKVIQSYRGQV